MLGIFMICMSILPTVAIGTHKVIIVEKPFYLRARLLDARTAHVHFEIGHDEAPRACHMYQFTVRRNHEKPYSMPEQNLTYWRNSLELQHLPAGHYRVCAIICSELLGQVGVGGSSQAKDNRTASITACVSFQVFRPHLLVFTLYVLVVIFLVISQVIFSLRKRQIQARVKLAMIEVEKSLQKWRSTQPPSASTDAALSYDTLHRVVTLPASPVEYSVPHLMPTTDNEPHPIIFHLEPPDEAQV